MDEIRIPAPIRNVLATRPECLRPRPPRKLFEPLESAWKTARFGIAIVIEKKGFSQTVQP